MAYGRGCCLRLFCRSNQREITIMNRLFFDIETCPNIGFFWKSGYRLNVSYENIIEERRIICISYKWESASAVTTLTWDRRKCDKKMLQLFSKVLAEADEVVYHNGDRFDWPWLNARLVKHGLPPVPKPNAADTLAWSRRLFNFNSNRLDYLGQFLLGEGKIKTEYSLWKSITLNNDQEALRKMVDYAEQDVVLLQRVWEKLSAFGPVKTHAARLNGGDKWESPHVADKVKRRNVKVAKTRVTARGTKQYQMQCKTTGKFYTISETAHSEYVEAMK